MRGLRYQKRMRVLPFLWLNVSKSSVSVSIGCRYVKLNIGRRGVWFSGSFVGTGLSFRKKVSVDKKSNTERVSN
ncbi:DUF4236 domain-containing protein [Vibrio parahaemolyticus]